MLSCDWSAPGNAGLLLADEAGARCQLTSAHYSVFTTLLQVRGELNSEDVRVNNSDNIDTINILHRWLYEREGGSWCQMSFIQASSTSNNRCKICSHMHTHAFLRMEKYFTSTIFGIKFISDHLVQGPLKYVLWVCWRKSNHYGFPSPPVQANALFSSWNCGWKEDNWIFV